MLMTRPPRVSRSLILQVIIPIFLLITPVARSSAAVVKGTVFDRETSRPVPFATVRVEGTGQSMLANENGQYRLLLAEGTYTLKYSHVAHYSELLTISAVDSVVVQDAYLHPAIIEVPGVKVYERAYDPAQRIIREAIAHKEELLAKIKAYRFEAYSKLVVRDTARDDSSNILVITENQLTSHWEYPDKYKEVVTARRYSSNLEEAEVLTAIGELTDFNKNRLDFGEYSVVSPTAVDAMDHYSFYLLDTVYIDRQRVFRLEIEPKNNHEPLFAGTIDIADSTFAVVGVDVGFNKAFDFPYLVDTRYRQHYAQFEGEFWMPIEISFFGLVDIPLPGVPKMSVEYVAVLHNFTFNTAPAAGTFDEYWYELTEDADDVDSATWNAGQLVPLTPDEIHGYQRIDSIHNAPQPLGKTLLRMGLGALFIGTGNRYEFFHFNRVEGPYIGAAISLNELIPNAGLRLRSGYAFSGEYWQHNYRVTYTLSKRRRLTIGAEYHDQIAHRPTIISPSRGSPTFMALTNKTDPFDYYLEKGFVAQVNTKIVTYTNFSFAFHDYNQYSVPNNTEYSLFRQTKKHRPNPGIADGKLRSVSARFDYDSRKLYKYKGNEGKIWANSFHIFSVMAEFASPRFIDNDFEFTRYRIWLYRRQQTLGYGSTTLELYAGASDKSLPPQKYFTVDFGVGFWEHDLYFKTLGESNFSGSRALTVYADHDFGRTLFLRSGLPLVRDIPFTLSVHGGVFWTDFENHPPQPGDSEIRLAPRPYSELGFGFGRIPPLQFKLSFTWQLSDYATNRFALTVGGGLEF